MPSQPNDERILDMLQQMRDARLDNTGGYPAEIDGETCPGFIVIADVDHKDAPELTVLAWDTARAWFERAQAFHEENPDEDMVMAMYETEDA